jgi:uncharacterized protein YgiM (DUF1202 family)
MTMMAKAGKTGRWTLVVAAMVFGLALLGWSASASAEEVVRLNTDANLRARPGERAPTLAKLDEGQKVRVIGRQGRWIKVSFKGKVGWLTRTQVDTDDDDDVAARPSADKKRNSSGGKARKAWSGDVDDDSIGADAVEDDEDMEDEPKAKPKKKVAKANKKSPKKVARAKKIGKGDEVVTTKSATVREKPSKKADDLWDADKGATMTVISVSEDGDWLKVQDEDGEKGWIASKDVAMQGGSDDEESDDEEVAMSDDGGDDEGMSDEDDEPAPKKVRKKGKRDPKAAGGIQIGAFANLGILSKNQAYSSGGTGLRANYALSNTAPAVIAGGSAHKDMGGYTVGAEGGVMMTVGGDGIKIGGAGDGMGMGTPEVLTWKALEINVRGVVGYTWDKKKGYTFQGFAGYHTSSVTVAVSDTAKLPSERITGYTVGAGLMLPGITDKVGLSMGASMLVGGKLEQTANLEDGESSAISAFYVGATATYDINPKMDAHASYQLSAEGFGFAGANTREPTAMNAKRQDTQHVIGVGLAYQF